MQETKKVISVLGELICLCTNSTDTNPLTREGIPIRAHQDILREQHVRTVVTLLIFNISPLADHRCLDASFEAHLLKTRRGDG